MLHSGQLRSGLRSVTFALAGCGTLPGGVGSGATASPDERVWNNKRRSLYR